MGAEAIIIGIGLAMSAAMAAQQASATRQSQKNQNAMIQAQLDEEARLRAEGNKLPDAEGLAVEEARRRRLTLSKDKDQRRNSAVNLTGSARERNPLVLASQEQQAARGDQ